jgi:hypothetical protein
MKIYSSGCMMCLTNSYSQMEFSNLKAIPPLDTGIKTKKSNSSNSCPTRYFSSNILKKNLEISVLILKLVILILFYDSNQ